MAIIDLTVRKPAWKRTEITQADGSSEEPNGEEKAEETADPISESGSGGRLRRKTAAAIVLGMGIVGALTLRKRRARRKDEHEAIEHTEG